MDKLKAIITTADVPVEDVGGARLKFLVSSEMSGDPQMAVLSGSVWPGLIVPLHSHTEAEIFYVQAGELETYQDTLGWTTVRQGDIVVIRGEVKHAWRNNSATTAEVLVFTGGNVCRWLQNLTRPFDAKLPPAPPSAEYLERLFDSVEAYGYWIASPEENVAIGLIGL